MSNLLSPAFIIFTIIMSGFAVSIILKNKVSKQTDHLIRTIIILPAIPLAWLMSSVKSDSPHIFFSFYLPFIFTVIVTLMLIVRIIKYYKNKL